MALIPNRTAKTGISESEQVIYNKSFDQDFNVIAIEALGHDSVNNVLRRIAVTSTGALKVVVA